MSPPKICKKNANFAISACVTTARTGIPYPAKPRAGLTGGGVRAVAEVDLVLHGLPLRRSRDISDGLVNNVE